MNIAFRRVSAPHHQRFENEPEDSEAEASLFHAEFRNPIFDETHIPEDSDGFKEFEISSGFGSFRSPKNSETTEDFENPDHDRSKDTNDSGVKQSVTPEIKKEIKEENFIDLEF